MKVKMLMKLDVAGLSRFTSGVGLRWRLFPVPRAQLDDRLLLLAVMRSPGSPDESRRPGHSRPGRLWLDNAASAVIRLVC